MSTGKTYLQKVRKLYDISEEEINTKLISFLATQITEMISSEICVDYKKLQYCFRRFKQSMKLKNIRTICLRTRGKLIKDIARLYIFSNKNTDEVVEDILKYCIDTNGACKDLDKKIEEPRNLYIESETLWMKIKNTADNDINNESFNDLIADLTSMLLIYTYEGKKGQMIRIARYIDERLKETPPINILRLICENKSGH